MLRRQILLIIETPASLAVLTDLHICPEGARLTEKITGYSVDTACSSSFAAIQLACSALRAKECDTAIAGGLNVMTSPDLYAGLSRAQFLSKTGSCKTFDDGADGFCRGDGVGAVVLKRLEDAEADNDPILAVVLGTATNHSADAVSMTQPYAPAQEFLYKKILNEAGVDARDVSYVEMHGTYISKMFNLLFGAFHQGFPSVVYSETWKLPGFFIAQISNF